MGTRVITADRAMGSASITTTTIIIEEGDEERFALATWPGGYHTRFPITPSPIPEGSDNPQTFSISTNYT